jgi:hypothetical protein
MNHNHKNHHHQNSGSISSNSSSSPQQQQQQTSSNRDMIFCVLFIGNERLIKDIVRISARELGAEWANESYESASLTKLRVMFFLLMDRDVKLKAKLLEGWKELCVPGVDRRKSEAFFLALGKEIIVPWLMDERRTADDFISAITDLYLIS